MNMSSLWSSSWKELIQALITVTKALATTLKAYTRETEAKTINSLFSKDPSSMYRGNRVDLPRAETGRISGNKKL